MSTAGLDAIRAERRLLVREHLPDYSVRMFQVAYALCRSREDAEDLVQETYARVLRRPRCLYQSGGELAYLLRVLRNVWYDTLRSRAAHPEIRMEFEHVEFVADSRADADTLLDARGAYAAIADLSAPLRETIVAVDIVGLSYKEAARALRTREGTIMSRLYQARRRVADALEGGQR
jgi:RNA polymerase sigma-70 factor (ECF subfamily)